MDNNSSHYRSRTESHRRSPWWMPLLALLIVTTGACGGGSAAEPGRVTVVATTSILGDIAANLVGDAGTVTVLMPRSADPHEYQASSRQVAELVSADLVIANGLHLEEGLDDVLTTAGSDGARIIWVGELVDPIPFGDASDGHGDFDPHFWFDPLRVAEAAGLIAGELEEIAPGYGWTGRAETYAADLRAADSEIVAVLAAIPPQQRHLVTSHDAFGYFAVRYGFEVIGTVIPGGSTMAEPSSAELSGLVGIIEAAGVPAIFTDAAESARLADALARELGDTVEVVSLHTGALDEPGTAAGTLIGMLTNNAQLIAGALS